MMSNTNHLSIIALKKIKVMRSNLQLGIEDIPLDFKTLCLFVNPD